MDPRIAAILKEADDPKHWEMPASFPWQAEIDRLRHLRPDFERAANRPLELDENIQDSAAFAELAAHAEPDSQRVIHTLVAIRFSAFGRLATVWSSTAQGSNGPRESEAIEAVLQHHGYSFVPTAELDETYDGCCRFGDRIETWWERFFGYP